MITGALSVRRIALAALAAAAATAAFAPSAHAGTYQMNSCNPAGINVPGRDVGPWTGFVDGAATAWGYDLNCSAGPSDTFGFNGLRLNPNTVAGVRLDAPANITIRGVKAWWRVNAHSSGSRTFGELRTEAGAQPGTAETPLVATSAPTEIALPSTTRSLRLDAFCSTSASTSCTWGHDLAPIVSILGTQVTLHENVQPSASIDGGSLTVSAPMKGTKTVSFSAADADSGVERVEVLLDGLVVAAQNDARDLTLPADQQTGYCTYTGWNACPTSRAGSLSVNTSAVPDGAYELSIRAFDAAGNQRTVSSGQPVVIDNVPDGAAPVAPTPVAVPGANGKDGRDGTSTVLTVNGANGSAGASLSAAFASSRSGIIKSRYGKKVLITGKLTAPSGAPITGARLWVMQQDKMVGAKMVPAGEVVTDSAGTFRYVTTALRSRTVRFGYRSHLENAAFSQTTDISLGVIAKISLSTDRRSLRNGQAVRFSGRVAGAPSNARKVVELQVKKGSTWMTFRSTRLRNGRFSERYRFTRTRGRATYAFRARVRQEAGFPFLTGVSPQAKVTVRG